MSLNRLSRGFSTHKDEAPMPKVEEYLKSPIALALGILSYSASSILLTIFKNCASFAASADEYSSSSTNWPAKLAGKSVQIITSGIGISSGILMVLSAKIFSLSQKFIWGKYVEKPSGDSSNTRLAWYGANEISTKDLFDIPAAFIRQPDSDQWTLTEWSQIVI